MSKETKSSIIEILIKMNSSNFDLDSFFETIEKDTGGKLTFTNFKLYLDKYYNTTTKSIKFL